MITVVTPFQRKENIDLMAKTLKGKANWTVLIDDESLKDLFPEWVTVKLMDKPPRRANLCPSNWLFNEFISQGLEAETQYMILCDDDSVEEGFFDKIPNDDVVICSMKRGEHVPMKNCAYGHGDLIASPNNIGIGKVGGEQCILKGKILRSFRYGLNSVGDGVMIMRVVEEYTPTYVPDAYVLFNYFEDGRYDSFHRKPLVIFVGDYFCAANPKMGKSEWEGNIWASLDSTGIADVLTFHMDKYLFHYGKRGDEALLAEINKRKPDYVVVVLYKPLGSDPTVIDVSTLASINVPIISIWGDLEASEQRMLAKQVEPFCTQVIGTANKEVVEGLGYTYMHVPKDSRIFNNPNKERDIDVLFNGSFGYGREERREVLQYLIDKGIKLVAGGSEGGDHFTTEEYADRYKRAKIAISFSQARGMNVVNARPFEAMNCGAMLIEQESPELAKLYTPETDYVSWKDKDDLYTKICYYLKHDNERNLIANNGYRKTQELYSAKTFWEKILQR